MGVDTESVQQESQVEAEVLFEDQDGEANGSESSVEETPTLDEAPESIENDAPEVVEQDVPAEAVEEELPEEPAARTLRADAKNELEIKWEGLTSPTTQVAGNGFRYRATISCQSDKGVGSGCEKVQLKMPFDREGLPAGADPFSGLGISTQVSGETGKIPVSWADAERSGLIISLPSTIDFGATTSVLVTLYLDGTKTPATEYTWDQVAEAVGSNTSTAVAEPVTYTAQTKVGLPYASVQWRWPEGVGRGNAADPYRLFPGTEFELSYYAWGLGGAGNGSTGEVEVGSVPDSGVLILNIPVGLAHVPVENADWPTPVWDEAGRTLTWSGLNAWNYDNQLPVRLKVTDEAVLNEVMPLPVTLKTTPIAWEEQQTSKTDTGMKVMLADDVIVGDTFNYSAKANRSNNQNFVGPSPAFPATSRNTLTIRNSTAAVHWASTWGVPCKNGAATTLAADFSGTCAQPGFFFEGFAFEGGSGEEETIEATLNFTGGGSETVDLKANPLWKLSDSAANSGKEVQTIDFVGYKPTGEKQSSLGIIVGMPDWVADNSYVNGSFRANASVKGAVTTSSSSKLFTPMLRAKTAQGTSTRLWSAGISYADFQFGIWAYPGNESFKSGILVPAGLEVTGVEDINEYENFDVISTTPNYDNTGKTLVLLEIHPDAREAYIRVKFNSPTEGIYTFESYIIGDDAGSAQAFTNNTCWNNGSVVTNNNATVREIPGDLVGSKSAQVAACTIVADNIITKPIPAYSISMLVKGAGGNQWVGAPGIANAQPNSAATYQLTFANTGPIALKSPVIYNMLPREGDQRSTGTFAGKSRGSEFAVSLSAKPTAAGATIAYTTDPNPCRPELGITEDCAEDAWSATAPSNLKDVTGLKFAYPVLTMVTGASRTATIPVNLPAFDDTQVAWNSAAAVASFADDSNSVPVETLNVGFGDVNRVGDYAVKLATKVADGQDNARPDASILQSRVGDRVTYTITATKNSGTDADPAPIITDDLASILGADGSKATLDEESLKRTSGVLTWKADTQQIQWNTGPLSGVEQTASFTVVLKDEVASVVANSVTATAVNGSGGTLNPVSCSAEENDDSCRESTVFVPRVRAQLSADPKSGSTVKGANTITYQLKVWFQGMVEGLTLPELEVSDQLAAVLEQGELDQSSIVSSGGSDWSYDEATKALLWTPTPGMVKVSASNEWKSAQLEFSVKLADEPTDAEGVDILNAMQAAFVGANSDRFTPAVGCEPGSAVSEGSKYLETTHFFGKDSTPEPTPTPIPTPTKPAPNQQIIVERRHGPDRYGTSADVNRQVMKAGKPLFIATGEVFPDALSAGPAVTVTGGSLVLSRYSGVSAEIMSLIQERKPSVVYFIGQTSSISKAVEKQVRDGLGDSVRYKRIGGIDRYETSMRIYEEFFSGSKEIFVTTGVDYPDALSAAAVAGTVSAPVVLVNGRSAKTLPAALQAKIKADGVAKANVVGGDLTVNPALFEDLGKFTATKRFFGSDRYGTNQAITDHLDTLSPIAEVERMWVAAGANFPDALSGSAVAGSFPQRLYLSKAECLPASVKKAIYSKTDLPIRYVTLIGGTASLNKSVFDLQACS